MRGGGPEQAGGVAAAGADTDLLALLLGGNETTASAFPATLEAALAGGDLAEEPIAGAETEGAGDDSDDAAATIDLAVAAALALGAALADASAPGADPRAPDAVGDSAVDVATALGGTATDATAAVAAAAVATAGAATSGTPGGTLTTSTSGTSLPAADVATTDAAARAAVADEAAATAADVAAAAEAAGDAAAATSAGDARDVTTSPVHAVDERGASAGRVGEPTFATKPLDDAPAEHGAGAGLEHATTTSFASGAAKHGGLDLGSSDRHGTSPGGEKPTAHAAATAERLPTAEAVLAPGAPAPDGADGGTTSTITTSISAPSSAGHDTGAAHGERTVHVPGAIEPRWGERVADAVRLSAVRGGGEIRLQLEPEGLGHIDVRLHVQGDGVRAVIVAEHESTRALLTSQQQVLHEALQRSDLRLSGFSVDVGSGGGAASFAQPDGEGRTADTPAAPTPTTAGGAPTSDADAATTSLANGRVSVRV